MYFSIQSTERERNRPCEYWNSETRVWRSEGCFPESGKPLSARSTLRHNLPESNLLLESLNQHHRHSRSRVQKSGVCQLECTSVTLVSLRVYSRENRHPACRTWVPEYTVATYSSLWFPESRTDGRVVRVVCACSIIPSIDDPFFMVRDVSGVISAPTSVWAVDIQHHWIYLVLPPIRSSWGMSPLDSLRFAKSLSVKIFGAVWFPESERLAPVSQLINIRIVLPA